MLEKARDIKIITLSFLALIVIGAVLLLLPIAHHGSLRVIDAFFTATSAVCVTGLNVKNTAIDFTLFGQIVILILIQIGGLGYMSATTFLFIMLGKRITYRDRLALKTSMSYDGMKGIIHFLKIVFLTTVSLEILGAAILTARFCIDMPFTRALWFGIFHSISAFNNAGFSLFTDGMIRYQGDVIINIVLPVLIICGGLGYLVIIELFHMYRHQVTRLSTHTKIVLWSSLILTLSAIFLLLSLEWDRALGNLSWYDKIMAAWFTAVNYRTAGFNTIELGSLSDANLFFGAFFMMIGGAPGGTAGGLKVTVIALALIGMWDTFRGRSHSTIFHRSIDPYQISKAHAIIMVGFTYVLLSTVILVEFERLPFLPTFFEVCSAFGTVGASIGNGGVLSHSALLSDIGKSNMIVLMFIGRIGVFAFTMIMIGNKKQSRIRYAEGRIIV